jgi:hypothetical protein
MADNLTPEQIAEAFDAYKRGQETLQQAQEAFGKSLGRSALQLSSSLYKGEKGLGQFGDAVEGVTTAITGLLLFLKPFSLAAKAAAVALTLFAKGVNMAAKQGDALFKTYQDLGRAGATASDGITGVFRNMQNFGYGIEELDKMVQLVTQNSETLAKFSLTAADGTNAFAEGMAKIQRDGQLVTLGKTTDDINSAGAAFIRQQVAMGRRQNDVQGQLGDRTKAYVLELDRLQKLTGTSADALQKQQDELLGEDAYNVYMEQLEAMGDAGKDQAAKIRATTALFPQYAKEIAQAIGGNVEAQQKIMFLMPNLIKDLRDPTKSFADTADAAKGDLSKFGGAFKESYLLMSASNREVFGTVKDFNAAQAAVADLKAREAAALKGQKVQDTATEAIAEARIANMNSRDAMQAFIQQGVAPATVALAGLAKAASGVAGAAAGAVGAPTGGAAAGSKAFGTMNYGKELYGTGLGLEGLPLKSGATAGGSHTEALTALAHRIHKELGGDLVYFSGLNDGYGRDKNSKHPLGRALDFTIKDASQSARIAALVRGMPGVSYVQDEYLNPSPNSSGNHIHAEVSAANGAILSGPMSGYRPNLTMHGTEAIVPLNTPGTQSAFSGSDNTALMSQQLDKLDELVRVMQSQVSVSTKILQAAN